MLVVLANKELVIEVGRLKGLKYADYEVFQLLELGSFYVAFI